MKNWNKRILSLTLAMALCLSFVACDSEEVTTDTPQALNTENNNYQGELNGEIPPQLSTTSGVSDFDDQYHTVNGNVTGLAVNQGLSLGVDQSTGEYYFMNTFVEKKETIVFAYLNDDEGVDLDYGTQYLDVYRDGELILHRTPDSGNITTPNRLAFAFRGELMDYLTAGNYELRLTTANGSATRNIILRSTPTIRILAVPMICNYGGRIVEAVDGWQTSGNYTSACYPISYDDLEYELGGWLDLSGAEYDLYTDQGCYNVWKALCDLQTQSQDYTIILGFSNGLMGVNGNVGGYTYGAPANIINSNTTDVPSIVAHEIAHCYLVGDEYDGGSYNFNSNIAPLGFSGRDAWYNTGDTLTGNRDYIISGLAFGLDTPYSGSVIYPAQEPFDIRNLMVWTEDNMATSFMGNCDGYADNRWITSAIWEQLYKAFTGANKDSEEVTSSTSCCPYCSGDLDVNNGCWYGECGYCGDFTLLEGDGDFVCTYCDSHNTLTYQNLYLECPNYDCCGYLIPYFDVIQSGNTISTAMSAVTEGTVEDFTVIDLFGQIGDDTFIPAPFYTYEGDNTYLTPNKTSDYRIELQDAEGNVVNTLSFVPEFWVNTNPPQELELAPIQLTMKYPETTKSIVVYHKDTPIHTMTVSENLPEVVVTSCPTGTLADEITLEWSGSDADGDSLYYEVWIQDYEDTQICLGSDIAETSLTIDTTQLPGTTDDGYFLIYVTDGINTNYTFSEDFAVAWKAPEFLTTDLPTTYQVTDEISIDLDVYDQQEGWMMEDEQLIWYDEAGKEIYQGAPLIFFPFELVPNKTHTFTCEATNSAGLSSTHELSFTIEDNEDSLPQGWYTDGVTYALSAGYVIPFNNIETAPITRYELAQGLYMLEAYYNEEMEFPDYDETLLTDLTLDLSTYEPFWAVTMGYMDAPNGIFNPYATVTEQEAMEALYQVVYSYIEDADQDMEGWYTEYLVLDDIPENNYAPEEKMTRAKMFYRFFSLVWLLEE